VPSCERAPRPPVRVVVAHGLRLEASSLGAPRRRRVACAFTDGQPFRSAHEPTRPTTANATEEKSRVAYFPQPENSEPQKPFFGASGTPPTRYIWNLPSSLIGIGNGAAAMVAAV
jgi:hypothetical protein